jgi:hypothetical protein
MNNLPVGAPHNLGQREASGIGLSPEGGSMKYSDVTMGQMEACINKMGGVENFKRFLRGELSITEPIRSWREEDGVIYFSVTSDGTTGEEWITRLEQGGFCVGDYAKQVLRSSDV